MDEMMRGQIDAIGVMWAKLADRWKPSLSPENRDALNREISAEILLYARISKPGNDARRFYLLSDELPPFRLEMAQESVTEKWGIKCSFLGGARWLGGLTHPNYAAVKAAFDYLVSDIGIIFETKGGYEGSDDPEAQWAVNGTQESPEPSSITTAAENAAPPMLKFKDVARSTSRLGAGGTLKVSLFGALCAGVIALPFILRSEHKLPPATPAPVPPAASATGSSGAPAPQVIGTSQQALPPVQDVLKGKMPSIPIPGGGTLTEKSQFKAFGMTAGPEMAPTAQANPHS